MRIISIPPRWAVLSPWTPDTQLPALGPGSLPILLGRGPGFGDGSHETTQLCLQAIAAFAPCGGQPWRMLDFGSGSGILAIAAARLGATVDAVEIEEIAIENARRNARFNDVTEHIRYAKTLHAIVGPFDLVVANILRPVLLHAARELVEATAPTGTLVLSGLVTTDVPEVTARYAPLLGGTRPDIYGRSDWCALSWRSVPHTA